VKLLVLDAGAPEDKDERRLGDLTTDCPLGGPGDSARLERRIGTELLAAEAVVGVGAASENQDTAIQEPNV
jgi:hypothetical protein